MTSEEWANGVPMRRIRTGVSINLRLDVYSDGQGTLFCPDDPQLNLPFRYRRELPAALRNLWDRALHEALTRSPFTD